MTNLQDMAQHYHSGHLLKRISDSSTVLDLTPPVSHDALAPVDEFHIGGRRATEPFVKGLLLSKGSHVADLGSGLVGPACYVAETTGAHVTSIDLTPEFVETGRALTEWTGLADRIEHVKGSVLDVPHKADSMDAAYIIHVGKNIADKAGIVREASPVLKPGRIFATYEVMQVGSGKMDYPAPLAASPDQSALAPPEAYEAALKSVGFKVGEWIDRTGFAKQFFAGLVAAQVNADGPPTLGLDLIMGYDTALKVRHMVQNIESGLIAPIEIHARLPG